MPDPRQPSDGSAATEYDRVAYPGFACTDSHPARTAVIGILHGLVPAPAESCRVLELGCGDGANLVPMAYQLPRARFIGLDLAAAPIERGRALIATLGLRNIELHVRDLMDATRALGEFDYIIAHGVYSWVPEPVRDRLLAVCRELLAPHGIAFVSYLVQPGTQMRDVLRQFLLRYGDETATPAARLARARTLARMIAESRASADPLQQALRALAAELEELSDGALYHDWLAPTNAAVRVTEFVAHARRHALEFLGEAEYFTTTFRHDPVLAEARPLLERLEREDPLAKEQLIDDLRCRRFRQTLLCRAGTPLSPPAPERVQDLWAAARLRVVGSPDVGSREVAEFRGVHDVAVRIDHPVAKAALVRLAHDWPGAVHFSRLLADARTAVQRTTARTEAEDMEVLAGVLLACAGSAHVELAAWAPGLALEPGVRPRASALARAELARRRTVTTLRHQHLRVDDALGAALLELLDGTRDRAALADALARRVEAGELALPEPVEEGPRAAIAAGLEKSLQGLARAALLEA